MSFLLIASLVWYSILLPTLPLEREIGPTVVNICLGWIGGLILLLWTRRVGLGKLVGGGSGTSWVTVQKFFNRSPITLKFGAPKLERESQERESESESEQVVIFFTLVSCYSTLVSCYFTLLSCHSTLVSCHFTLVNCHSTLVSWWRS